MTTEEARKDEAGSAERQRRPSSESRFPVYDLADSVQVAKVIHDRAGGVATDDQLAAHLGYKSTANGAYLARMAAARLFGLIRKDGNHFRLEPRAQQILMPVYPDQARQGLVDSWMSVPLYKSIYEEHKGRELPPEFGMKNLLRMRFGILPSRLDTAYRVLMDSAEQAGLFSTRGSKTHLILPSFPGSTSAPQQQDVETPDDKAEERSGGGGRPPPYTPAGSADDLKNQYVATLIEIMREKGKQGDIDLELMERIERLLGLEGVENR